MATKPEMVEEILNKLAVRLHSKKGQRILSAIGSCVTKSQLESCKHWVDRIVDDRAEKVYYQSMITARFGQVDGSKFDV